MLVTEVSTASLQTVARLADSGEVKPFIGKIYPFSDVARAWTDARTMHIDGKIVFAVGAAVAASRSTGSGGRRS